MLLPYRSHFTKFHNWGAGCFKISFTTVKAYIHLFRRYVQYFYSQNLSNTATLLTQLLEVVTSLDFSEDA
jgi:hypothetical protein